MSSNVIEQFRSALTCRGIIPPAQLLADGQLHRCDSEGKNGKKDAAYVLHLDGLPAGGFENHCDGQGWQNWHAQGNVSDAEKAAYRAKLEAINQQQHADKAQRKQQTQVAAQALWQHASSALGHPYLRKKRLYEYGTKQIAITQARDIVPNLPNGLEGHLLLVPLRDSTGTLHSVQCITETGIKRFLTGTCKQGSYFSIGKPDKVLCIAEGFATAASIYQATRYAVAVAFDAGNLFAVAQTMRAKFPDITPVICADDDLNTPNNPGLSKAHEAAQAVNGKVAVPDFGDTRPDNATDFNDLHPHSGLSAVAACIQAALQLPAPAASINKPEPMTCPHAGGYFELSQRGVLFHPENTDSEGKAKATIWLCSPLRIEAKTRDASSNAWGRLLALGEEDSGGFHLRGASSSGKSTALKLAASVWGDPRRYGRLWRTTSNGLEGLAALHNDTTLILDELSQLDPKQAGEAAYLLANGQGKTRANRSGCARQSARWRVLFLSSGEQSLSDLMTQAGKKTNAGQLHAIPMTRIRPLPVTHFHTII